MLCSGVPMIPFFPLALNDEKYTRVRLIMHKASVENAGQNLNQSGFPIEMNYSPIHRRKWENLRFSSLWATGADAMKGEKYERKKMDVHLCLGTFVFILWRHLQLEFACNAARYKMESRSGESLNRCWYKLKASKGLAFCCQEDWCRCAALASVDWNEKFVNLFHVKPHCYLTSKEAVLP